MSIPARARRLVPTTAVFIMALALSSAHADDLPAFEAFAQGYAAAAPEQRPEMAEEFIRLQQARSGFPLVGADGSVVFFYRAQPGEAVRLLGDFSPRAVLNFYWSPAGLEMEPLAPGATVFIRRMKFEPDAHLNYAFRVNGQFRTDPLNPYTDVGGPQGDEAQRVSDLRLPRYSVPPETEARAGVPHGELIDVMETWAAPAVHIYLPPGYSTASRYPVVYTADGSGWRDLMRLPVILDNLIADHTITPVIAVMIDSRADRGDWYNYNPEYFAYLEKVVAYVDAHYSTKATAESRVHFGTSAGARGALFAALARPDLFRKVALLSPGLGTGPHVLGPYFTGETRPDRRLDVWMSVGTYEGGMVDDLKFFDRYLTRARIRHHTVYAHGGHNFSNWRQMMRPALVYFFAP